MKPEQFIDIEQDVQDYINFLNDADVMGELVLTPSKIDKNFQQVGEALNILLAYPDLLIDIMTPEESSFSMFFFQRISFRSMARHRQTYMVATRGASKSFMAFASRYIMSMSVPNHHTFVCAGQKNQAMAIASEKVEDDLWVKFPLLKNEMVKIPQPGKPPKQPFKSSQDIVEFNFTGGGSFDVINADSARGKRRHSGIIEEVIEQDATKLNEKVIPLMNISRRNLRGELIPTEPHASKIYVTTAGYHDTLAYNKFLESLCLTAIDPNKYMVISMSYRIPLMHGLIDEQTIREIMSSPTFEKESFDREYGSKWSGAMKGAAFNRNTVTKTRKIVRAEHSYSIPDGSNDFYVVTADMAKDGSANTAVAVLKISPRDYNFLYQVVNAFTIDTTDYKAVADELKLAVQRYKAEYLVYDASGIGAAIRDWINRDSVDNSGQTLPGLGIINPPTSAEKDVIKYPKSRTICYEIKSAGTASDINTLFFGRLKSGAVKMLISSQEAISKFKDKKSFNEASLETQKRKLKPYHMTDKIQEELLNLDVADVSDNGKSSLKIKRRNAAIQKDFFSAISYGIYVVHIERELKYYKSRKKAKISPASYIMFSG